MTATVGVRGALLLGYCMSLQWACKPLACSWKKEDEA